MANNKRPGRKNEEVDVEELPNQARRMREAKDLTLRHVASLIKSHWNALAQYEKEGVGISRVKRAALAKIFETDLVSLETPGKKFAEKSTKKFDAQVQNILDIVR